MTDKLIQVEDLIKQARKICWDFIEDTVKKNPSQLHTFSKDNAPKITIEDEEGVHNLRVKSISPLQVFFLDDTEFDIGDLDTDQLKIVAEYLEMDIEK